jgi:peptidoglycan-N-acetylglucosamine deacetylase
VAETVPWADGRTTAVTLSYDDGLQVHRELVAPMLAERGLRATFYVPIGSTDLQSNVDGWRAVARAGHELGNHSIVHPCRADAHPDVRSWLRPENDLAAYTPQRWRDEMSAANFALHLIDGRARRTFGNTCDDTEIGIGPGRTSLEPLIAELFVAGRGPATGRPVDPDAANLAALGCVIGDFLTFDRFRAQIESAVGEWLIYEIHGVGEGTHRLFVDGAEQERLLDYLGERTDTVLTAPLVEIASSLSGLS